MFKVKFKKKTTLLLLVMIALTSLMLTSCGCSNDEPEDTLGRFERVDVSEYPGLKGYTGETPFVGVTVKDVHELIESKATFVLFISFEKCPWCNVVIKNFCDVATEFGATVAHIDTRKNPEWKSNLDIDDYDLFVQDFDEYLDYDGEGIKHLYVPHVFFIKEGKVVYEHQGAVASISDPGADITETQEEEIRNLYREGFEALK